jgi:glycosyltransferase involved in cell wall biosynthesis
MQTKPLVSVLMSVYNGERYIRESIDSVLGQSYENFELLVIDDCSTDSTTRIVKGFQDRRVRLIRNKKNIGSYPSLNVGIRSSAGELIAINDADDISLPFRLQMQVQKLVGDPNLLMCGSYYHIIGEKGDYLDTIAIGGVRYEDLYLDLHFMNYIDHSTVMMRKDVVTRLGGYDTSRPHVRDYELWNRFAAAGKIAMVRVPLVLWRHHGTSVTVSKVDFQNRLAAEVKEKVFYSYYTGNRPRMVRALFYPGGRNDEDETRRESVSTRRAWYTFIYLLKIITSKRVGALPLKRRYLAVKGCRIIGGVVAEILRGARKGRSE